jgi:uncharacterized protein (DUF58 family)
MARDLFDAQFLKTLEYLELIARRFVFGRQQAQRISMRKGASIEFKDYREYSPGDDPRTVDWSIYARIGELVVKLFRQEQELDLWVLLDRSASMGFGDPSKFDTARQIAAALAYIGMCNMDSASVTPFDDALNVGRERLRGRGRVFQLLDFLRTLEPNGRTNLETATRAFVSRVRRPGLVVIVSDFYGLQASRKALDQLRYFKHEMFVIQTVTPWELDPPIRGELRLVDSENGGHADLVISDSMLKRYRREFAGFSEDLRRYSMRHSMGYALARSDVPFDDFLVKVLERGGLVA